MGILTPPLLIENVLICSLVYNFSTPLIEPNTKFAHFNANSTRLAAAVEVKFGTSALLPLNFQHKNFHVHWH